MSGERFGRTGPTDATRRPPRFRLLTLLALVGLSAGLFGLWRALAVRPPARVSGVVTHEGQPIGSAVIRFEPLDPTGRRASGVVVDGRYVVEAGVLPGRYAVGIRDGRQVLPARYGLPKTSGLSAKVLDARANSIDFELR